MKNILRKIFALFFILFGLYAALACLTYQSADSSFNAAGTFATQNKAGYWGAVLADLMLQFFGAAAFAVPVAAVVFGLFVWRRTKWIWFRFFMFLCAFFTVAWLLHDWETPLNSLWFKAGTGGFAGYFLNRMLVLPSGFYRFAAYVAALICLIFALKVPVVLLSRKAAATVRAVPAGRLKAIVRSACRQKAETAVRKMPADKSFSEPEFLETAQTKEETLPEQSAGEDTRFLFGKKETPVVPERTEPVFGFLRKTEPAGKDTEQQNESAAFETAETAKQGFDMEKSAPVLENKSHAALELPSPALLDPVKTSTVKKLSPEDIDSISRALERVLAQFKAKGKITGANPGPVVTLYQFSPDDGIQSARVIALADDIAMKMSVESVRMAVIPGTCYIGIEMPNKQRETVYIREMIENAGFQQNSGSLPIVLGKDIGGTPVFADLAKMPHLLVAGTTGSGKSVAVNAMILSLLYRFTPAECRMIMVDPKMVELSVYNRIPHLLTPVVIEPEKAVTALKWAVREMEDRYRSMAQLGVRNIDGYNQKLAQAVREGRVLTRRVQTGFDPETGHPVFEEQRFDLTPFPYIVIIVDEMADLMGRCGKEVDPLIQRLAQMARAVGIHLILATQRPSVDVITGTIKSNFPSRMSFQVRSKIDSRTILDEQGAERLLGRGDMLFMPAGAKPQRIHGPFVSDDDVERVVHHWEMQAEPEYVEAVTLDPDASSEADDTGGASEDMEGGDLYDKAVAVVLRDRKPTISYVQRVLRIGYNKAADLIDRMEAEGVISKPNLAGKRDIIVPADNA